MTSFQEMLGSLSAVAEAQGEALLALGRDPEAAHWFEVMEATERLSLLLTAKNENTERIVDRLMEAHP